LNAFRWNSLQAADATSAAWLWRGSSAPERNRLRRVARSPAPKPSWARSKSREHQQGRRPHIGPLQVSCGPEAPRVVRSWTIDPRDAVALASSRLHISPSSSQTSCLVSIDTGITGEIDDEAGPMAASGLPPFRNRSYFSRGKPILRRQHAYHPCEILWGRENLKKHLGEQEAFRHGRRCGFARRRSATSARSVGDVHNYQYYPVHSHEAETSTPLTSSRVGGGGLSLTDTPNSGSWGCARAKPRPRKEKHPWAGVHDLKDGRAEPAAR